MSNKDYYGGGGQQYYPPQGEFLYLGYAFDLQWALMDSLPGLGGPPGVRLSV